MLLVFAIVLVLKRYLTEAAPLSMQDSYSPGLLLFSRDDSTIVDNCHGRTVWNILWSCLATTFACTWLSVHPNVPFKNEGKWEILGRRIFLMFYSIIAPEIMVMWAFKQWRGAVMIKNAVNDALPGPQQPWTVSHGHFLQMGGFRFSMTRKELDGLRVWPQYWEKQVQRIIHTDGDEEVVEGLLTYESFKKLLSRGLISFPTITEDEINDKSKGDALSKGIASVQLAWFIVQIITRAVQGLAVTELELTTAALAGLNSIMYLFWWSKPLGVRCPVIIQTKSAQKLLQNISEGESWTFAESEFTLRKCVWQAVTSFLLDVVIHADELMRSLSRAVSRLWNRLCGFPSATAKTLGRLKQTLPKRRQDLQDNPGTCYVKSLRRVVELPMEIIATPIAAVLGDPYFSRTEYWGDMTTMMFYSEDTNARPLLGSSAVAGAIFGGVHCFAWHFAFPSVVERIMWRSASLTVAASCTMVFLGCLFPDDGFDRIPENLLNCIAFSSAILYPIARICLLVLAVTSLRLLPPSALDTVHWIELVPHI